MTKWTRRALTLSRDELQTIGFVFGIVCVAFWIIAAVALPDSPPPNPVIVTVVGGLLAQQAFRKDTNDEDKPSGVVPPDVDGPRTADHERPPTGGDGGVDGPVHRSAVHVARRLAEACRRAGARAGAVTTGQCRSPVLG